VPAITDWRGTHRGQEHCQRLKTTTFIKLGVTDRTQAVVIALQHGLVDYSYEQKY